PLVLELPALVARVPALADFLGHGERFVRPADVLARRGDFILAERGAMHAFRAGLVRRTEADHGAAADQRGLVGVLARSLDGGPDLFGVVAVDVADHVPAVGLEALRRVVAEPAGDVAVDGNAVVVIEADQLAEAKHAGQRAGLVRNAFHEAAVTGKEIRVVIDDLVARLVELRGQDLLRERHADGIGQALAQRAGGGLDARRFAVLRVTRRLRMQ